MIIRRHARRALVWTAAGIGGLGLLGYLLALFMSISYGAGPLPCPECGAPATEQSA